MSIVTKTLLMRSYHKHQIVHVFKVYEETCLMGHIIEMEISEEMVQCDPKQS